MMMRLWGCGQSGELVGKGRRPVRALFARIVHQGDAVAKRLSTSPQVGSYRPCCRDFLHSDFVY